ncbi:MAG: 2-oxoglutarate dehydrogenase complex dihydrolipoyllysine-residue succinyltransferase, partial [Candidatus Margulisiibacteriota bacterium]
ADQGGDAVAHSAPAAAPAPAATQPAKKTEPYAKGHPSPAAAKAMAEKGVSSQDLQGSGKDGRITKQDVAQTSAPEKAPAPSAAPTGERNDRVEKMSRLRRTIASRLVEAQHTAALLTTFNEIDMSAVMDIRKRYKDAFKEKHQVNLGFMSFFTKAVCVALQEFPVINASVEGEDIIYHDYCDIGVAVATPKGLVVPIIRNAEKMRFEQIEKTIVGFALKARENKITPDDMLGGTFTITNGGVFGSMLSTPIINRPQSAILGMHNIVERAVVVDGQVVVRPIMYGAVTYDHRIIDGAEAVRFLVKIKSLIEDPTRLLIGL